MVGEAFAWRCDEEYEIHGRIAGEEEPSVVVVPGAVGLRDGVVSTEAWLKTMKWVGIDKFQATERKVWEVNGTCHVMNVLLNKCLCIKMLFTKIARYLTTSNLIKLHLWALQFFMKISHQQLED